MKPARLLALCLLLAAVVPAHAELKAWDFTITGDWPDEIGTATGRITFDTNSSHAVPTMIEVFYGHSDTFNTDLVPFTITPDDTNYTVAGDFIISGNTLIGFDFHASSTLGAIERSVSFNNMVDPEFVPRYSVNDGHTGPVSSASQHTFDRNLSIPEPSTYALLALGFAALMTARRMKRLKA